MSIIKDGSLLSNLSNISVLIKPGHNSSIFNLPMMQQPYEQDSQKMHEVKLEDIFPEPNPTNNSMLDRIMHKEESGLPMASHSPILPHFTNYPHQPFNEKTWMITHQKGVSEDEESPPPPPLPQERDQVEEPEDERRIKNETKNIPKNYGKAIITFIERYRSVVERVCEHTNVPYSEFMEDMFEMKKTINTIADLRRLWMDYRFARCMRIISNLFFRKYSLNYIFNSRICNFRSHIKYRHRLWEAIRNPRGFRHIKDY